MRLQRIKISGFLGHQNESEIDFSSAGLWLVHGANGSGKSSFWDALMYAFFKKTRGKINVNELIHDSEPKAQICVEFVLNGQSFQICCEIKRKLGSNNRFLQTKNGEGWRTIANRDTEVNDWIKKQLQISPETFTSAVLLQQGKADAFFTCISEKRKEVLLELLNLKFYRELGKLAAKNKSDFEKDKKRLEGNLIDLPNPSAEEISMQGELIEEARGLLKKLEDKHKDKETEKRNAQDAQDWQADIGKKEAEQKQIAGLVEHSVRIEANAQRFRELKDVLSPLESFWQAHETIQLKNSELAQFAEVLQRRDKIENDFARYETLGENLPKLHQLKKDEGNLHQAKLKHEEIKGNLERLNLDVEEAGKKVEKLKAAFDAKEIEKKTVLEKLTEIDKHLHSKRQMLESRNETTGAAECAFCGSELETEKAKARLADKHKTWQKEIDELEAEKGKTPKLSEVEGETKQAKTEWESADRHFHQTDKNLTEVSTQFNSKKEAIEGCQNILLESLEKTGDWADKIENLEILTNEFNVLKNAPSENGKLLNAQIEESKTQAIVLLLEGQIIEHRKNISPNFQFALENKDELEKIISEKTKLQNAEAEEGNLRGARDRQNVLKGELKTLRGQLEKIPSEHRRSVAEVITELSELNQKIDLQKVEFRRTENDLSNLKIQQKNYTAKENEFGQAAREFDLWKKLAEALGKGKNGLEAVLVQKAQEQIKFGANDILRRLSRMRFEIELNEVSENELEIRVQDNHTNSSRPFENYSGGEKFCVAVSLALAIGQTANQGRTAQTLIIDEGFGALDEDNRKSLAAEFHTLSRDVLQGGCVIVVSHQDDVCEAFTNRYRLNKGEKGFVEIRRNENI